jgi:hypothetical protein
MRIPSNHRTSVPGRLPERLKPPLGLRKALSRADALREQGFRSVDGSESPIPSSERNGHPEVAPRVTFSGTIASARPKDLLSDGLNVAPPLRRVRIHRSDVVDRTSHVQARRRKILRSRADDRAADGFVRRSLRMTIAGVSARSIWSARRGADAHPMRAVRAAVRYERRRMFSPVTRFAPVGICPMFSSPTRFVFLRERRNAPSSAQDRARDRRIYVRPRMGRMQGAILSSRFCRLDPSVARRLLRDGRFLAALPE